MKKGINAVATTSVVTLLPEVCKLVDKLVNAYQRKKELEVEMLKEQAKNEQELKRLENSRIELTYIHEETMRKLDEFENILKLELSRDDESRRTFNKQSHELLNLLKQMGDAALMEEDKDTRKQLLDASFRYAELLQIVVDNFQTESTKRYVEGPAVLRSISLTEKTVKKIGENK